MDESEVREQERFDRRMAIEQAQRAELERLREFQRNTEEAEARCCPEDVGFEEWIGILTKRLAAARPEERTYYANPQQVPQRGEAVNLARNVLDYYGVECGRGMHLTTKGIRDLASALLLLDAWISEVTKRHSSPLAPQFKEKP